MPVSIKRLVWLPLVLVLAANAMAEPPNPTSDIPWSPAQFWDIPVSEIESAFNNARDQEEIQLGSTLPTLVMPSQAAWDAMNDNEKALFLINEERVARGVQAFEGHDPQVIGVAQGFADWLLTNDAWGHDQDVDGDTVLEGPWDRLFNDAAIAPPDIAACNEFLTRAENLAVFVSSSSSFPPDEPVARSIYGWLYDDSGSAWGHRLACFVEPLNDNSGMSGMEGLQGFGVASGGPYQGPFGSAWPSAVIVVMNFFDPCSTWNFGATAVPDLVSAKSMLRAASPNPFNPRTQVSFDIAQEGRVELAIYDLAGKLVRVLADRTYSVGQHVVGWDGTDASGAAVASGVYVGRLRAPDQDSLLKLTLLK